MSNYLSVCIQGPIVKMSDYNQMLLEWRKLLSNRAKMMVIQWHQFIFVKSINKVNEHLNKVLITALDSIQKFKSMTKSINPLPQWHDHTNKTAFLSFFLWFSRINSDSSFCKPISFFFLEFWDLIICSPADRYDFNTQRSSRM